MTEQITSIQNPKIKLLAALQQKSSERRKAGLFVVEGQQELQHCMDAGYEIDTVFFCPELGAEAPDGVRSFAVTRAIYEKIAYRGSTEGMIAEVRTKILHLADLNLPDQPLIVILESFLGSTLHLAGILHLGHAHTGAGAAWFHKAGQPQTRHDGLRIQRIVPVQMNRIGHLHLEGL